MKNLIVIGNGFDLAHNLKTSYGHFIRYVIKARYENRNLLTDLIQGCSYGGADTVLKNPRQYISSNNLFFVSVLDDMKEKNWCDIEKLYFSELNDNKYNVKKKLNEDFDIIKKHLQFYLTEEEKSINPISAYENFFRQVDNSETIILNFNYTSVLKKYTLTKAKVINIHGELNSESNPIIFGYAANESEIQQFHAKDDNEYLRNIKRYNYNRTNNFRDLIDYLLNNPNINIHLFGHSIGLSDKLILNEILTHKNIKSIRTYYFENYESYFQILSNMDRIMKSREHFDKVETFPNCSRMPQHNDTIHQTENFHRYTMDFFNKYQSEEETKSFAYNLPVT